MKIGAMNHPAKPVYDEVISFGKARFEFVDLTIEGPNAVNIDPEKMRPILDRYHLAVTGHTNPASHGHIQFFDPVNLVLF